MWVVILLRLFMLLIICSLLWCVQKLVIGVVCLVQMFRWWCIVLGLLLVWFLVVKCSLQCLMMVVLGIFSFIMVLSGWLILVSSLFSVEVWARLCGQLLRMKLLWVLFCVRCFLSMFKRMLLDIRCLVFIIVLVFMFSGVLVVIVVCSMLLVEIWGIVNLVLS